MTTQQPTKRSGWLLAGAIIVGIVLACAILPLGGIAILAGTGGNTNAAAPATTWQEKVISGQGVDRIVVLDVEGVIGGADQTSLLSATLTHEQLLSQIKQASEDERVKAVVVRVNSPGGGVVASAEIHAELKQLRDAGKHLVISMGDTAASGGYYIATAAERIYAHPDTLTGSLGVIISTLNLEEAYAKLGVEQLVFKSGEFKDILSPTRDPAPEEVAILQGVVDQAYQGFVDVIVEGRKLDPEAVLRIADGRIYTGKQALDLKLIDHLGGQDEAIAGATELAGLQDALVVRYTNTGSFRDLLLGSLQQMQRPSDPLGVRGMLQPQGPRLEYRLY